ncbi:hypothetical protein MHU86_16078 [Fragilaria crotonensis]|nr:hypothetical protein MHU86_16078 [Fragilaria crotonensis]
MPSSPKSEVTRSTGGSDHSQSSAMRTAQDLLRRNRAKRMEADRKKQLGQENLPEDEPSVGNEFSESGSDDICHFRFFCMDGHVPPMTAKGAHSANGQSAHEQVAR